LHLSVHAPAYSLFQHLSIFVPAQKTTEQTSIFRANDSSEGKLTCCLRDSNRPAAEQATDPMRGGRS
jgi:hypothetical protein